MTFYRKAVGGSFILKTTTNVSPLLGSVWGKMRTAPATFDIGKSPQISMLQSGKNVPPRPSWIWYFWYLTCQHCGAEWESSFSQEPRSGQAGGEVEQQNGPLASLFGDRPAWRKGSTSVIRLFIKLKPKSELLISGCIGRVYHSLYEMLHITD